MQIINITHARNIRIFHNGEELIKIKNNQKLRSLGIEIRNGLCQLSLIMITELIFLFAAVKNLGQ